MRRFLSPVPVVLVLICCGTLPAQSREQEKATWAEIADRCQTEQPVQPLESPGRLLTVRAGKDTYRIFLSDGRVIHCMDTEANEKQPAVQVDQGLQEIVEKAKSDLGQRLAVKPGEIQVLRAERVTWRDSSAGCPEDGQMYMQVLTEGARVFLRVSGTEYRYHQVAGAAPFLCENPSRIEPLPGPEIQ